MFKKLIECVVDIRDDFREKKEWRLADKIRNDLEGIGIELKDASYGTWYKGITHGLVWRKGIKGGKMTLYGLLRRADIDRTLDYVLTLDEEVIDTTREAYQGTINELLSFPLKKEDAKIIVEWSDDYAYVDYMSKGENYAIDVGVDWLDLVGCEIVVDDDAMAKLDNSWEKVLGWILYEITFNGYTREAVLAFTDHIDELAGNIKMKFKL